jgi:hypothetical protein
MVQSRTRTGNCVALDPVDCTFDPLFLAQLRGYLGLYARVFPDQRLYGRFAQAVKGIIPRCRHLGWGRRG